MKAKPKRKTYKDPLIGIYTDVKKGFKKFAQRTDLVDPLPKAWTKQKRGYV